MVAPHRGPSKMDTGQPLDNPSSTSYWVLGDEATEPLPALDQSLMLERLALWEEPGVRQTWSEAGWARSTLAWVTCPPEALSYSSVRQEEKIHQSFNH